MSRRSIAASIALVLATAGCDRPVASRADDMPAGQRETASAFPAPPPSAVAIASTSAAPSPAAPTLDYPALRQIVDPDRFLRFYGEALEARDWPAATRAWGRGGPISAAALQTRYAALAPFKLSFAKGTAEGGAGSIYYEVGFTLIPARGGTQTGTITLRRVNDVPGSTAAQHRWHIMSMTGIEPAQAQ